MPRYSYHCSKCESSFDISHRLGAEYTLCKNCGEDGFLERQMSQTFIYKNKDDKGSGNRVNNAIEEAREELEQDKEILQDKRYDK